MSEWTPSDYADASAPGGPALRDRLRAELSRGDAARGREKVLRIALAQEVRQLLKWADEAHAGRWLEGAALRARAAELVVLLHSLGMEDDA